MPGGKYDSSKTRVGPVFDAMATHEGWVRRLLQLAQTGHPMARSLDGLDLTATKTHWQSSSRRTSELGLSPSRTLLRWMASNPKMLRRSTSTNDKRQKLLDGDPVKLSAALDSIDKGAPSRAWYVFEGTTYPDAVIETPSAIIVVEGKRTEPGPTTHTEWLEGRHQIWRHIEGALDYSGGKPVFGLFVVESTELRPPELWRDAARDALSEAALETSFPHLSADQRDEIAKCFLGVTTWRAICAEFGIDYGSLPDEVTNG